MSKSLQIKELPENIYYKLTELARTERRSLAQQAVIALTKGLDLEEDPQGKREKVLARLSLRQTELDAQFKNLPDPVDLIREDRER